MKQYFYSLSFLVLVTAIRKGAPVLEDVKVAQANRTSAISLGEDITLHCSLSVHQAGEIWYLWRSTVQDRTLALSQQEEFSTSDTLILHISEDSPPHFLVFCHVLESSTNTTVGIGKLKIEIQGIVVGSENSGLDSDRNRDLLLQVLLNRNMSTSAFLALYLSNVRIRWESTALTGAPNDYEGESLPNTLHIDDPTTSDSGMYRARIVQLLSETNPCYLINGDNLDYTIYELSSCSRFALLLLTHTALARPVEYSVKVQNNGNQSVVTEVPALNEDPPHFYSFLPPGRTPWVEEFEVPLLNHSEFQLHEVLLNVYFNGIRVPYHVNKEENARPNDEYIHSPKNLHYNYQLSDEEPMATVRLDLPRPSLQDVGIYEIFFTLYPSQVSLLCCPKLENLLLNSAGVNIQSFVIGLATVTLERSGLPSVMVKTDRHNITSVENAVLTCTPDSGVNGSRLSEFEWKKDGESLASSRSFESALVLSTESLRNPYGEYECLIGDGFSTKSKSINISEEVQIQYVLHSVEETNCDGASRWRTESFMIQLLYAILETLCQCQLTSTNLFDKSTSCEDGDITFDINFAFSNAGGSVIASSLATEAEQWISGERVLNGINYIIQAGNTTTLSEVQNDQGQQHEIIWIMVIVVVCCLVIGVLAGVVMCAMQRYCPSFRKRKTSKVHVSIDSMATDVNVLQQLNIHHPTHPCRPPKLAQQSSLHCSVTKDLKFASKTSSGDGKCGIQGDDYPNSDKNWMAKSKNICQESVKSTSQDLPISLEDNPSYNQMEFLTERDGRTTGRETLTYEYPRTSAQLHLNPISAGLVSGYTGAVHDSDDYEN